MSTRTGLTYIKYVKDPDEIIFPSTEYILVVLRVQESGGCVSFPQLDDILLDVGYSSLI